jgi:hypothetical protein
LGGSSSVSLKTVPDGLETYSKPTEAFVSSLGLGSTPQTIVISSQGKIEKNWIGAYGDDTKKEVEDYFGVVLPGLTDESATH